MITQSAYTQVEQRGTLDTSHAQTLGIDASGIAAILNILTNMYSNPALAVVREYACNARDSHVEAGKHLVPIEVSLPTGLDPQLKVQDFGLGLSKDEILNTYAKYGSSTKRTSNELIGAMGIGSKSAFTVGNQFTVTGVKDGQKTVSLFALNAHGEPTVDILFEGPTEEPNGVLVDIGVENVQAVRDAAAQLFKTWDQGTVHVDGQRPFHVWTGSHNLGDDGYLVVSDHRLQYNESHVHIVMGGVGYKLNQSAIASLTYPVRSWLEDLSRSFAVFYVNVPIGAVDITPSREELRVTAHTTATLNDALTKLSKNLPKWINSEIESAETFTDAAVMVRKLKNVLGWGDYKGLVWKGKKFDTDRFQLQLPNFRVVSRGRYSENKQTKVDHTTHMSLDMDLDNTIVVTNVPEGKSSTVRRYTKAILLERNERENGENRVIASPHASENVHWFSYGNGGPVETIDFDDWRELGKSLMKRVGSTTASGAKAEATYEVHGETDELTASDIIALGEDVAYYDYKSYYPNGNSLAEEALEDYTVIMLGKGQRESTLVKRVPGTRRAGEVIREHASKILDGMTSTDKNLITNNRYLANVSHSHFNWLLARKDRITNKAILEHIRFHERAQKAAAADSARLKALQAAAATLGRTLDVGTVKEGLNMNHSLPILALYLQEQYTARRIATDVMWEDQLLNYVNNASI